jgi:hypothetical protein
MRKPPFFAPLTRMSDTLRLAFYLAVSSSMFACGKSEQPRASADTHSPRAPASAVAGPAAATDAKLDHRTSTDGSIGIVVDTVTIWLDSTTIQSAVHALGYGDDVLKWVSEGAAVLTCFRTTAGDTTYLALTSHDGDTGPVIAATISRDALRQSYFQSCAPLATPSRIGTTIRLRLGMSQTEVERLLGAPRRVEKNVTWYAISSPDARSSSAPASDGKDRAAYFVVQYREDVLVRATIYRGNEIISQQMQR